ncbi:MFS transporter [Streptomyces sp. NPDC059009]|uniref:MFS transporter n=1 Tax=Streptomyces sp. NPDC059009 TaxID=3346694 RepID=UPI00367E11E9
MPETELTPRRRFLVLAICCMSLFIATLDATALNVALPSMAREFDTSISGMQWAVDAYTVVLASLLILAGSTADRAGRRRVFQAGLALFMLGSLLCSLAPTLQALVPFRAVQAIGGSMLNPVAMSIITNTFRAPRERARAIGVWGGVVGISMAAGPLAGGLLVEAVGWRSIFWVNLPVCAAALLLTARYVPESRAPKPRRPDPVGQLLVTALLGSVTYAIIEAPSAGPASPLIRALIGCAVLSLLALLVYERRRPEPLIELRFFRSAPFSGATLIAICAFAGLGGFLFLTTLYLQSVRGLDALHTGLWVASMAAVQVVCAPLSGRLVGGRGPRVPLLISGVMLTSACVLFAAFGAERETGTRLAAYILFGIGMGFVNTPITNTAVSGMPRARAGVAAAVASTSRQVGFGLGVAVSGSVLASGVVSGSYGPQSAAASRPAWWILAGCGAAVLVLGLVTSGRWARGTAEALWAEEEAEPVRPEVTDNKI